MPSSATWRIGGGYRRPSNPTRKTSPTISRLRPHSKPSARRLSTVLNIALGVFSKIAGEVGKVAKGTQDITQAAEALAKGDKKLLERLRAAAGDAALTDTISEGLRPGLGARVGAEITVDGTLSTEMKVFYKVDDKGRSFVTHIKRAQEWRGQPQG